MLKWSLFWDKSKFKKPKKIVPKFTMLKSANKISCVQTVDVVPSFFFFRGLYLNAPFFFQIFPGWFFGVPVRVFPI
jgi:hypothetical protein